MSANEKNFQKSVSTVRPCAIIAATDGKRGAEDEASVLGKTVLHGLTIIIVGLRKYLKVERCDTCGR